MKTLVETKSKKSSKKWSSAVSADLASEAIRISKSIADRMLEGDTLADTIQLLPEQSSTTFWDGYGLMQGFAGLAVMYNQLDRCFPGEGWRRVGSHFLKIASEIFEESGGLVYGQSDVSICSGSSGLAYVALQSPRGKSRYSSLLSQVDQLLKQDIPQKLNAIDSQNGLREGQFDVLYGITGIGRYLMANGSSKQPANNFPRLLKTLVYLSSLKDGVPRLYTPHDLLHSLEQETFKTDIVNCGLAHGIPGPLALMALALKGGYEVEGLAQAVEFWSKWLMDNRADDEWGINWPGSVCAAKDTKEKLRPSRVAWCYGIPGVARALFLAGDALNDSKAKELAVQAMLSNNKRPLKVQNNQSAPFCHGRSGLLQITLRFFQDTGLEEFKNSSENLCKELLDKFDEEKIWGYCDIGSSIENIDNPGLLNGAAGVVLSLLAASCPVEPIWDQTFLLS